MGTVVKKSAMIFNILLKKEGDLFVTHCLELDIVSTSPDIEAAKSEYPGLFVETNAILFIWVMKSWAFKVLLLPLNAG